MIRAVRYRKANQIKAVYGKKCSKTNEKEEEKIDNEKRNANTRHGMIISLRTRSRRHIKNSAMIGLQVQVRGIRTLLGSTKIGALDRGK